VCDADRQSTVLEPDLLDGAFALPRPRCAAISVHDHRVCAASRGNAPRAEKKQEPEQKQGCERGADEPAASGRRAFGRRKLCVERGEQARAFSAHVKLVCVEF